MSDSASHDYRWVLRFSTIAFLILTAHQMYGVTRMVPAMRELFRGFGADLPEHTTWILEHHSNVSIVIALASLVSTGYLLMRKDAPPAALKFGYAASIVSLVAAFAWSGWVQKAMFEPIFRIGAVI